MTRLATLCSLVALVGLSACGGGGKSPAADAGSTEPDAAPSPFDEKPECAGESIEPMMGSRQMVISELAIGKAADGLDLDGDGEPDNTMAALGSLAEDSIAESLAGYTLVLPMEFFDVAELGEDDCVKFAVYQGVYRLDQDGDSHQSAGDLGDCNDTLLGVHRGATEILGNGIDDDCDGLADEDGATASVDESDADGDGVSIAAGDCDDTNSAIKPGLDEVCGDGLDNNCDTVADWVVDADPQYCSPFDEEQDLITISEQSFDSGGAPTVAFTSGTITMQDGVLRLVSGPSLFRLTLPLAAGLEVDLVITAATLEADVVMTPGGPALHNGKLGGVLAADTTDQIRGLDVEIIDLKPGDSLADAIYANVLGAIFALQAGPQGTEQEGCLRPDIDVDGDGLEAFCDTTPDDAVKAIDKCVDGDGTVVLDSGNTQCTEALDEDGNPRFIDGVSILIEFETVPATLPASLP